MHRIGTAGSNRLLRLEHPNLQNRDRQLLPRIYIAVNLTRSTRPLLLGIWFTGQRAQNQGDDGVYQYVGPA